MLIPDLVMRPGLDGVACGTDAAYAVLMVVLTPTVIPPKATSVDVILSDPALRGTAPEHAEPGPGAEAGPGSACPAPDPPRVGGDRRCVVGAVVAGARSFAAIEQWASDLTGEQLVELGLTRSTAPNASTFRKVLACGVPAPPPTPRRTWCPRSTTPPAPARATRDRGQQQRDPNRQNTPDRRRPDRCRGHGRCTPRPTPPHPSSTATGTTCSPSRPTNRTCTPAALARGGRALQRDHRARPPVRRTIKVVTARPGSPSPGQPGPLRSDAGHHSRRTRSAAPPSGAVDSCLVVVWPEQGIHSRDC
jgi:hypothetical protein